MLATGDGTPGFKWGSTNAYTEDAAGKPVYDWTIADRIFDTYLAGRRQAVRRDRLHAARRFIAAGALSARPGFPAPRTGPVRHRLVVSSRRIIAKWGELVYQWVKHTRGEVRDATRCESWYWEVWNEPDIALLARNSGGVRQTVRLCGCGGEAGVAHGARWADRPPPGPSARRRPRSCASSWSTAPAERMPQPARPARRSTSSLITPKAGPPWWMATCAWASRRTPKTWTRGMRSSAVSEVPRICRSC